MCLVGDDVDAAVTALNNFRSDGYQKHQIIISMLSIKYTVSGLVINSIATDWLSMLGLNNGQSKMITGKKWMCLQWYAYLLEYNIPYQCLMKFSHLDNRGENVLQIQFQLAKY